MYFQVSPLPLIFLLSNSLLSSAELLGLNTPADHNKSVDTKGVHKCQQHCKYNWVMYFHILTDMIIQWPVNCVYTMYKPCTHIVVHSSIYWCIVAE